MSLRVYFLICVPKVDTGIVFCDLPLILHFRATISGKLKVALNSIAM